MHNADKLGAFELSADAFSGRHTCIFVGAGSSKALFDVPIQSDLIPNLLLWDDRNDNRPHLSQPLRRLLKAIRDIELVLSHYHNLAYQRGAGRNSEYVREFLLLRVALAQYLDDVVRGSALTCTPSAKELLQQFLPGRQLDASNLFIVSTNYDTILEDMLDGIFGSGSCWYPGLSAPSRTDAIPVLKLHGSINWMEDRGHVSKGDLSRTGKPVRIAAPSAMKLKPSSGETGYFFEHAAAKYTPIIIPFLFQKDAWLKEGLRVRSCFLIF